jgi:hypothetical protein
MQWKNLNNNQCPKCGMYLEKKSNGFECKIKECGFFITNKKMAELSDTFSRDDFKSEMEGYGF